MPPTTPRRGGSREGQGRDDKSKTVCVTEDLGEQPHTQRAAWLGGDLMPSG
jgi:hypothetical protein